MTRPVGLCSIGCEKYPAARSPSPERTTSQGRPSRTRLSTQPASESRVRGPTRSTGEAVAPFRARWARGGAGRGPAPPWRRRGSTVRVDGATVLGRGRIACRRRGECRQRSSRQARPTLRVVASGERRFRAGCSDRGDSPLQEINRSKSWWSQPIGVPPPPRPRHEPTLARRAAGLEPRSRVSRRREHRQTKGECVASSSSSFFQVTLGPGSGREMTEIRSTAVRLPGDQDPPCAVVPQSHEEGRQLFRRLELRTMVRRSDRGCCARDSRTRRARECRLRWRFPPRPPAGTRPPRTARAGGFSTR